MTDILSDMRDRGLLLGAIADDFTGGSDMAGMLARQGVRTIQTFGVPDANTREQLCGADAVVVSLKSRSIPPQAAVDVSLKALNELRQLGAAQIQFKYCSTFDSTAHGNIGPVTSALMAGLNAASTIAVPALPVNRRTQYMGNLFVNGVPLAESPMRDHPLNPMTDSNLVRHLQLQTERRVGLIDWHKVHAQEPFPLGDTEIALVDALEDEDLFRIARQYAVDLPLITGGSGISYALPSVWREGGEWQPVQRDAHPYAPGRALLLAGSCSAATLTQIRHWIDNGGAAEAMQVDRLEEGSEVQRLCDRAATSKRTMLIYSSAPTQQRYGNPEQIERAFAELARLMRDRLDVLIVAGGETSGAVVEALGIRAVEIGPEIDPGIPALQTTDGSGVRLALKSGNFGAPDFFAKACRALNGTAG